MKKKYASIIAVVLLCAAGALAQNTGAIFTTDSSCTDVNGNLYTSKTAVYLDGGPHGDSHSGLPDGDYWVRVSDPSTAAVLGTSASANFVVSGGEVQGCYQLMAIAPFADTPNPGGEYKVTVSMDPAFPPQESKTDNFKVACTKPDPPSVQNGGPYCIGAEPISVSLSAGDVAGGSYSWTGPNGFTASGRYVTDSASGPGSAEYCVAVTVNGCTSSASCTTVVVHAIPATPAPSNAGPYCFYSNPTTVQLHANAAADSYSWSGPNGFTSSSADPTDSIAAPGSYTYSLTVTVNGCASAAGETTIVVNQPPAVSVLAGGPLTFCLGGSVTLSANATGTGPFSYLWSNGATTSSIATGTSGSYSVTVTDANGCSTSSGSTVVTTLFCACSLTQGAYGSTGGAGSVSQVTSLIGAGLTIGFSTRSFKLVNTDAPCFVLRMPAGGQPAILPVGPTAFTSGYSTCSQNNASLVSKGKFTDVLMGQTFTLSLNVRGDAGLSSVPLCPSMQTQKLIGNVPDPNSPAVAFTMPSSVISWLNANGGANVGNLLALANQALGGATGLPPLSDINTAVNNVNVYFDGCRAEVSCQ